MSAPHKHAELIKAWADGERIEGRPAIGRGDWRFVEKPRWVESWEYRVYDKYREFKDAALAGKTVQLRPTDCEAAWVDVYPPSLRDPSWFTKLDTNPPLTGGHWELRVKPKPVIEKKKVVRAHTFAWYKPGEAPTFNAAPAPFQMPAIALEISYERDSGRVTDVQLKGWKQ